MENKQVGWLVIGIAIVMAIMVLIFNNLIKSNIGLTCSHGPTCEMYTDLNIQTWISLSIVAVVFIIGLVILFSKPREKIIVKHQTKTIKEKIKPINKAGLEEKEKQVVEILEKENAIFQSELKERMGIGKVGITRLLDKLEAKQIIERKRRGMNNVIVLKR